jgi:8-hydroxy-5-deazaflavin:NADPH oxidoreductase
MPAGAARIAGGATMQVAVLGTGNVGSTLGLGWARRGHLVVFGSRDPDSGEVQRLLQQSNGKAAAATLPKAVERAEVVVVALPWPAAKAVLPTLAAALKGKILVDCTNPVLRWPLMDHSSGSGGEQLAAMVPNARVVKAFNSTGFDNMRDPRYPEGAATMFYAGNDAAAKQAVRGLITDLGFDPVDCGPLAQSLTLEVLASLWGSLASDPQIGRNIAFRLMRRA